MSKLALLLLSVLFGLFACNKKSQQKFNQANYLITPVKIYDFGPGLTPCYTHDHFFYYTGAINNSGTLAGTISVFNNSASVARCYNQGFLLSSLNSNKKLELIDVLIPNDHDTFWLTGLSSNNISVGFTTHHHDVNHATINQQNTPIITKDIQKFTFVNSISENGKYATLNGFHEIDFAGYDVENKTITPLFYEGKPAVDLLTVKIVQMDNSGTAIGYAKNLDERHSDNNHIFGLMCLPDNNLTNSINCLKVNNDEQINYKLTKISSNGNWIYGEKDYEDAQDISHIIFLLTKDSNKKFVINNIDTLNNFQFDSDQFSATDDGVVTIIKTNNPRFQYFYVPENNLIYSSIDFIKSFGNINFEGIILISPNGKYVFISKKYDFVNDVLGVELYLPEGIGKYLINHVKPAL